MKKSFFALGLLMLASAVNAEIVGSVDTTFKMIGANDKIVIEAFDDQVVGGVSCYLSRAKTGGVMGSVNLAEDTSDAALSCLQAGKITIPADMDDGEDVFEKSTSIFFKSMKVKRFHDKKRDVLIYLVYSTKIIDGSPKNAVATVPVRPWK